MAVASRKNEVCVTKPPVFLNILDSNVLLYLFVIGYFVV